MTILPTNIGSRLAVLRSEAGVTQSSVAINLSTDQSRISRIEKGEVTPSFSEVQTYLESLKTHSASNYLLYLSKEWKILNPPTPETPDIESIWMAEEKLGILQTFELEKELPGPVRAEVDMHRQSLLDAARFLSSLDYQIAFIGDIGVGKTTTLCVVAGLVLSDGKGSPDKKVVLETGAGRITVCEVRIRPGLNWGITIEPQQESEIYRLVSDICETVKSKTDLKDPNMDSKGIPRELDRAIRNMAKLGRIHKKISDEKRITQDPLKELAQSIDTLDELRAEFSSRLQLWKRTKREIYWDEKSKLKPPEWLSDTFTKINNGRLEDVSLPKHIDIIVPTNALEQGDFNVSYIDTRGVDGTAIRPDLKAYLDDPRTITILCSSFRAAPDATMVGFMEHAINTGSGRALLERVSLLVLPHPGDAKEMKDEVTGEKVDTENDGYELKKVDVQTKLESLGAKDVPVMFFNATSDPVQPFREDLFLQIRRVRKAHVERIFSLSRAIDNLIANYEIQTTVLVRREAKRHLQIFADQYQSLPEKIQAVYDPLITALHTLHPRTVWATTRRQGSWYNLDVFYYIGTGAASEAKRRSDPAVLGLQAVIKNLLGNPELKDAHNFLEEVQNYSIVWSEKFVQAARRVGEEVFRPSLEGATVLWSDCESIWGQGREYRLEVAGNVKNWFLAPERNGLHSLLERRIIDAWKLEFIQPLRSILDNIE